MTMTTKLSARLDAVQKAKTAYVVARTTLEARLREQMRTELANLQTQIDIAVRYAVDAGESKASILRALGTKDYGTINASLDRTQGVAEVIGADPLAEVYSLVDDILYVRYTGHGPSNAYGNATFMLKELEDGKTLLIANDPLWNDDYTVRNDAVALLDGKLDGYYYEEVVEWMANKA